MQYPRQRIIPDFKLTNFFGVNTSVKDIKELRPGFSPDSKNWITGRDKDHIELRRGTALLGQTRNTDAGGKITGLGVGIKYDKTQVPFFSYGRKVKYYDAASDDVIEVGSSILGTAADGEDVWFQAYQNLAGYFEYFGSPNSGVFKVPVSNPRNAVDQGVNDYRWGVFHVGNNRSLAGQRNGTVAGNNDKTGFYLSYIDKAQLSDFTQTTGEAYGTGDGSTKTFTHALSIITAPFTAMYIAVTDGVETFVDDRNGNMLGDKGGTGTINYSTGAVSVTFNTAPLLLAVITCSYYHEDSTSQGILDFTGSANGEGKSFRQDNGSGRLMAIYSLYNVEYCIHELKTYQFTASLDDTESTNLEYRNVGISYPRAAWQTPDGIIFADLARPATPKFRRLQVLQGTSNTTIEPEPISDSLDLTGDGFDQCVAYAWGDYEMFEVQEKTNGSTNSYNSKTYIRNVFSGVYDILDYYYSCAGTYQGTLIAGDSVSSNVFTLFSGYDDDGEIISNYWTSSDLNLGLENMKNCRRMVVSGLIQKDQQLRVSLSYDGGDFSEIFVIDGAGSYVDTGVDVYIGGKTIGSEVEGGGDADTAHPFEADFPINSDRFLRVRIKIEALSIGFVQANSFLFKDIRDKGRHNLPTRTV